MNHDNRDFLPVLLIASFGAGLIAGLFAGIFLALGMIGSIA